MTLQVLYCLSTVLVMSMSIASKHNVEFSDSEGNLLVRSDHDVAHNYLGKGKLFRI